MGNATTVPDATMTRREFVGWMLASVAAIVAGSRIWRLFRRLAEGPQLAMVKGYVDDVSNAVGRITEVDTMRGTMTIAWDQHGRPWTVA